MKSGHFQPDYRRVVAASQNKEETLFPLYEHAVSREVVKALTGIKVTELYESSNADDIDRMFRCISEFHRSHGYDTFSFEGCFTQLVQQGNGLCGLSPSIITKMEDLEQYPWQDLPGRFMERFGRYFDSIRRTLPDGMKIVGGVGNGVFESTQDFVPLTELAYLEADNPELFSRLWERVGEALLATWRIFLDGYADIIAVARFGDDLGFKSAPLLSPTTICTHILPHYKEIVAEIHSRGIPFLLHSCGSLFVIMDDIIATGIDAKHSNEDAIALFSQWVDEYGERIGNFGGLDMDVICRGSEEKIRGYIRETLLPLKGKRGIAVGSGNQIASYVPPQNFEIMVDEIRKIREY